jgi:peptidoglycan-N-acetylglucosamine deacetylase
MYFIKTPSLVKRIFSNQVWSIPSVDRSIYLTFDDGPTPGVTRWILNLLKKYNAKATFFLVGNNVRKYPQLSQLITEEGHGIGNHTYNHLNGWQTDNGQYLKDIYKCRNLIPSNLFRPPYGKITRAQSRRLSDHFKVVMWDVLSGDFDQTLDKDKVVENVINNTVEGSVIVFHDSVKARERMQYALPKVLEHFTNLGYRFDTLSPIS